MHSSVADPVGVVHSAVADLGGMALPRAVVDPGGLYMAVVDLRGV